MAVSESIKEIVNKAAMQAAPVVVMTLGYAEKGSCLATMQNQQENQAKKWGAGAGNAEMQVGCAR